MTWPLPRSERRWLQLVWPREVTNDQLLTALLAIHGLSMSHGRDPLLIQTVAQGNRVVHTVGVPTSRAGGLRRQLEAAIPGIGVEPITGDTPDIEVDRVWHGRFGSHVRPISSDNVEAVSSALLTALAAVGQRELLILRWTLGPARRPRFVTGKEPDENGGLGRSVLRMPFVAPATMDAAGRKALTNKQGLPGWRATLQLGVKADAVSRQRQLLSQMASAMRMAQGPGADIGFIERPRRSLATSRWIWRWPVTVNVMELRGLVSWPTGLTDAQPVKQLHSRRLPPDRRVPRTGRIVAMSTWPGKERPLAITPRDATRALHVIGPSGVGKSTLLLNLAVADMEAGLPIVAIEPKGDLVQEILERVPDHRVKDVVIVDPADHAPVGLNPLISHGRPPELLVDEILSVFTGLFGDGIGPRSHDMLTAGLLTLTRSPGMSLAALPVLFADAGFRERLVSRISDPVALEPFWSWFANLSTAERAAALGPLMNKVRRFLLSERIRRVIGQAEPRFDLRSVFSRPYIVLVDLSVGSLGSETAGLLGSLVFSQLWRGAMERQAVPQAQRHPVSVLIDEFQLFLHMPTDLADVLAMARSTGISIVASHQHLGQLTPNVRAALLANAGSRVIFRTNNDDAKALIGHDQRLKPADVHGLGKYEAYVSLLADGETTPFASARTLPPPPVVRSADELRQRSRERWGIPGTEVDAALANLITGNQKARPDKATNDIFGVIDRDAERDDGTEDDQRSSQ